MPAGTMTPKTSIMVKAFDVASAYDLKAAREVFDHDTVAKPLLANPLLVQYPDGPIVAVFDYGSIVFFDFTDDGIRKITDQIARCAVRPNAIVSRDDFTLHVATQQAEPSGTDEMIVKELSRDIALVVSIVLSRSVSLEYYEGQVANALAKIEDTVGTLAKTGTIPIGGRDLTRQVGFGLSVEHELAYTISVFDDPDVVWDSGERMNALYRALKREFDLEDRIRILQQKISLISRSSTFIISRLEGRRSQWLEWIIIVLILSEIVLALIRH
jgi:uncharacterized Rmd1/YagE family protein